MQGTETKEHAQAEAKSARNSLKRYHRMLCCPMKQLKEAHLRLAAPRLDFCTYELNGGPEIRRQVSAVTEKEAVKREMNCLFPVSPGEE